MLKAWLKEKDGKISFLVCLISLYTFLSNSALVQTGLFACVSDGEKITNDRWDGQDKDGPKDKVIIGVGL